MNVEEIKKIGKQQYPKATENELSYFVFGYLAGQQEKEKTKESFFTELAEKLRDLWPSGEKDNKWPWRDSVVNLTKRLSFLWEQRQLGEKYTLDDCLTAARRYLSQFENNVKYMQTLKYFIFKQDKLVAPTGKITYTYKSTFADLLTDSVTAAMQNDWESVFESSNTLEQGELI